MVLTWGNMWFVIFVCADSRIVVFNTENSFFVYARHSYSMKISTETFNLPLFLFIGGSKVF